MERSAEAPSSLPKPGDRVDAKYEVQAILGKGGMGVVVAALHLDLQEVVALKFLLPEASEHPETIERFLTEARAVRRLRSEHVVKVLDVGRLSATGLPYMAMELLVGEDLAHRLKASGPMDPAVACGHVIQACEAIAEAHAAGIVHRDLKPANLFELRGAGEDRGPIKVLDFGIAKVLDAGGGTTRTQAVMGSATYMSPEQLRSTKHVDGRTDLWSLGATLYELLTGRHPFEGESLTELIVAITCDPPVSPRTRRPELPPALEAVVLRCLEKDPARRFQTAADLAVALADFAGEADRSLAAALQARCAAGAGVPVRAFDHGPATLEGEGLASPGVGLSTVASFGVSRRDLRPAEAPRSRHKLALGLASLLLVALLGVGFSSRPAPAPVAAGSAALAVRESPEVVTQVPPSAAPSPPGVTSAELPPVIPVIPVTSAAVPAVPAASVRKVPAGRPAPVPPSPPGNAPLPSNPSKLGSSVD